VSIHTLILLVESFDLKNRLPYNLYCVGGDVKPCSINQSTVNKQVSRIVHESNVSCQVAVRLLPESVASVCLATPHMETDLLCEVPLFFEKVLQPLRHLWQLLKSTHPRLNVVKVHLQHHNSSWQSIQFATRRWTARWPQRYVVLPDNSRLHTRKFTHSCLHLLS